MDGEIYFNMFREPHPIYGKSEYLLKRWQKYTIYAKSGSYKRSNNPGGNIWYSASYQIATLPHTQSFYKDGNMYSTNSIYLYDYVIVNDTWLLNNVYTASVIDFTPAADSLYVGDINGTASFMHHANTWLNSPNAKTNEYLLTFDPVKSLSPIPVGVGHTVYDLPIIRRDDGTYFEIVRGYPRNHYSHKRGYFTLERYTSYGLIGRTTTSSSYRKGQQTIGTTIGPSGLSDGSDPVQTTQVTNIDIIKSDNVIYH